ncbi:MAG: XRE family transcriptional regulator [Hyphomicrobiaceae bacterium TMED74]|nr:hypothetical protein [Filomicrobium sp.]RPG41072.1 MAG: XRE family transcriptional regulator [Hyphomicrobiaceae bacterium TMED74]
MSIDKQIGAKLKQLRLERAEDPKRIAAIIGVTPAHYVSFEEGQAKMSARLLFDLSLYLKVPIRSFFDDHDLAADSQEKG